jgi:VanZ family protein
VESSSKKQIITGLFLNKAYLLFPLIKFLCGLILIGLIASLFWAGQAGHAAGAVRPPWDKVIHFCFWGGCAALLRIAAWQSSQKMLIFFYLALAAIALIEELVQLYTPGRSFELADIFAGWLGITIVSFVIRMQRL